MKQYTTTEREERLARYFRRTLRNKLFAMLLMVIWTVLLPVIEAPVIIHWIMSLFIIFTFLYPEQII